MTKFTLEETLLSVVNYLNYVKINELFFIAEKSITPNKEIIYSIRALKDKNAIKQSKEVISSMPALKQTFNAYFGKSSGEQIIFFDRNMFAKKGSSTIVNTNQEILVYQSAILTFID